jgi:ABC-type branched-subunit amino acid transport system permease subunit
MTILGGMNSFLGPMTGAFFWHGGAAYINSFQTLAVPLTDISIDVSDYVQYWKLLFGLAFVFIVSINPDGGIWGSTKSIMSWIAGAIRTALNRGESK